MKITRKIVFTIMLILATLSITSFAAEKTFKDVPKDAWYYDDVMNAVEKGLINGKNTSTYAPNDNLTYAETVKLAACMHKLSVDGSAGFETGTPWYASYVKYAKAVGIITKDYNWEKPITRAEYMNIFSKAIPKENLKAINKVPDNAIPDIEMSDSSASAIYTLYRAGIVQGSDENYSCKPTENINRAEVAAILTRMMDSAARKRFSLSITGYDEYDAKLYEYKKEIKRICGNVEVYDDYTESQSVNKLSLHQAYWYGEDDGGIFKYALYDIDNDKTPELLLTSSSAYNDSLIDIYTLDNGKIVKLFENCVFGERMQLRILSDGTLLDISSNGSENAYVLGEGKLVKTEALTSESMYNNLSWKVFADLMAEKPNPMDKLPKLSEIKEKLTDALVETLGGIKESYSGIKDFKIENVAGENHDQTFSCSMLPSEDGNTRFRVMGSVKEGKIIEMQSLFFGEAAQVDDDVKVGLITLTAFPLGIYQEELKTASEVWGFVRGMDEVENAGGTADNLRLVCDDMEYTYMIGTANEKFVLLTFTIRYLPAFNNVGFLEE